MPKPTGSTAIILFADIVDSTALTERMGDAAFRSLARRLDATLRDRIREHAGRPIEGKLLGDGVLAVFESARSAIDCALRCSADGGAIGLPLHVGVHAGDVIKEANNVFGGAVNVAARIAAVSPAGQVFVSDTVRGLARTSADVHFEDAGTHDLKGVGEELRLFRVRRMGGAGISLSAPVARHTRDRPKRRWWIAAGIVAVAALAAGATAGVVLATRSSGNDDRAERTFPSTVLRVGGNEIALQVARTFEEQQAIGSANADGLVAGEGRLYDGVAAAAEWETTGYAGAIDLVWVDASKAVIGVVDDVQAGRAQGADRRLTAPEGVRYAIELATGQAAALGLDAGAQLSFFTATTLRIGGHDVNAEVACTLPEQLEIGLVGRHALVDDHALLYDWQRVIDERGDRITTWSTAGYRFPIDIIWLDAEKKVIDITPDVAADQSGIPQPDGMRYAIESSPGAAVRWGLSPGAVLIFDVPC